MALATHACGAEAEAVRISRLVGLVCCECHIAMFFFCNLLGTMVFLFHADNNVSEVFRHTTQNGSKGAFSVLLRKVWLKGFRKQPITTNPTTPGGGARKSAGVLQKKRREGGAAPSPRKET